MNSPVAKFDNRQRPSDDASQKATLAGARRQDFSQMTAAGRATATEQTRRLLSANVHAQMNAIFAAARLAGFIAVAR
jgi:deoxycytidylate deaminase